MKMKVELLLNSIKVLTVVKNLSVFVYINIYLSCFMVSLSVGICVCVCVCVSDNIYYSSACGKV